MRSAGANPATQPVAPLVRREPVSSPRRPLNEDQAPLCAAISRSWVPPCPLGACVLAATAAADAPSLFTRPGEMLGHTLRFRGMLGAEPGRAHAADPAPGGRRRMDADRDRRGRARRLLPGPLARRRDRQLRRARADRRHPGAGGRRRAADHQRDGLPAGARDVVRPGLLRPPHRVRTGDEPRAAGRRASHAALRHAGGGLLRAASRSRCRSSIAGRSPTARATTSPRPPRRWSG